MFCDCEVCQNAVIGGGKDLRTRSQALVNDDLLIDFGMDTATHAVKYGINLANLQNVLITHSHFDHFFPQEFLNRTARLSHSVENKVINIYGNQAVKDKFFKVLEGDIDSYAMQRINIVVLQLFQPCKIGKYTVTPLAARHMKAEQAFLYVISCGEKSILYGNDTGEIGEESYEFLKNKQQLNLVSLDCGEALNQTGTYGHMNLLECASVKNRLAEIGALAHDCQYILNHISHNSGGLHDQIQSQATKQGFSVAYDGLKLDV